MLDIMKMKEMAEGNKKLNDPVWLTTLIDKPADTWGVTLQKDLGLTEDQANDAAKNIRDMVKGINARQEEIKNNLRNQGVTSGYDDRIKISKANSASLILSEALVNRRVTSLSGPAVDVYKQAKSDLTINKIIDI